MGLAGVNECPGCGNANSNRWETRQRQAGKWCQRQLAGSEPVAWQRAAKALQTFPFYSQAAINWRELPTIDICGCVGLCMCLLATSDLGVRHIQLADLAATAIRLSEAAALSPL